MLFLPSTHASDVLERLQMFFVSVDLSGICLYHSERYCCASNSSILTLLFHFPIVSPPSWMHTFRYPPKTQNGFLKPYQGQSGKCCSSVLPGAPALSSLISHAGKFYIPLSTCLDSLALELPFYLCFSYPRQG